MALLMAMRPELALWLIIFLSMLKAVMQQDRVCWGHRWLVVRQSGSTG